MAEGMLGNLNRHFVAVADWIFTVGGSVASLAIGGAWAWVGGLCLLVGAATLTTFAYEQWSLRRRETEERETAAQRFADALRDAHGRAEQAERKLKEVPADLLLRLERAVQRYSFHELASFLGDYADYVARMKDLSGTVTKTIALRTFAKRAGDLYVDAKLSAEALAHLRQDDPFLLDFKDTSGLVTASALLRVHQMDAAKELVWFRIDIRSGEELEHIDALAEKQEVPGKGYTARPVCDVLRYSSFNLGTMGALLRVLSEEALRLRGQ